MFVVNPGKDCVLRSQIRGHTLEELRKRYSTAEAMDYESAVAVRDAAMTAAPAESTATIFNEALEALPPIRWRRGFGDSESFMSPEVVVDNIASIHARIGTDYWSLLATQTLTHEETVALVLSA
jgi:hypothetical protein